MVEQWGVEPQSKQASDTRQAIIINLKELFLFIPALWAGVAALRLNPLGQSVQIIVSKVIYNPGLCCLWQYRHNVLTASTTSQNRNLKN